jgi:prepilin-type N-terminal cleavage/methylation domain-containing protein
MLTHASNPSSRSPGFTLLELMIAISILALVLVTIAGSFNAVIHSKFHGEERLYVDREGRAILREISNELRGAVQVPIAPTHVALEGNPQMRDRTPIDGVAVATLTAGHRRAITGLGTEELVAYSVAPNRQHRKWFILTRTEMSGLLTGHASASPPIVLAENLVLLHIKYFDGNSWSESWDSSALPKGTQLPVAVSIDLALGTNNGRVMNFSTQVMLPMAVDVW